MAVNNNTQSHVSWKDYVDARIAALEKDAQQATVVMDRRLAAMNEFREALRDQAALMATRKELEVALVGVNSELRQLRDFRVALEAKASQQSVNVSLALALIAIVVSIVRLFIR